MSWKVLVTARAFWVSGQEAEKALRDSGCQVVRAPRAGPLNEQELISLLQDCDAVVASSDRYTAEVFSSCPGLKMVSRCGVGIDSIDLDAAAAAGVVISNTPGAMTDAVADYTFALMLSLARQVVEGHNLMRSGGWGEYPGVLVSGKTLGLVGFGQIGQAVAQRASGFRMKVLAYDPPLQQRTNPTGSSAVALPGAQPLTSPVQPAAPGVATEVEFTSLEELLSRSDFVSVHAPATPETRELFNAARFRQMKPTAYFINTARGSLVDEAALVRALEEGRIAGAAVDVYQQEPVPPEHPLRRAPRCVLTPHNAFNAVEAAGAMSRISAENILTLMRGRRPAAVCNPAVWDSPALRLSGFSIQAENHN